MPNQVFFNETNTFFYITVYLFVLVVLLIKHKKKPRSFLDICLAAMVTSFLIAAIELTTHMTSYIEIGGKLYPFTTILLEFIAVLAIAIYVISIEEIKLQESLKEKEEKAE